MIHLLSFTALLFDYSNYLLLDLLFITESTNERSD